MPRNGSFQIVRGDIGKAVELDVRLGERPIGALDLLGARQDHFHDRLTKIGGRVLVILVPGIAAAGDALLPQREGGARHQPDLAVGLAHLDRLLRIARPVHDFDMLRPEPQQEFRLARGEPHREHAARLRLEVGGRLVKLRQAVGGEHRLVRLH